MKNFVLFFEEKEGSTAVVQSLDALGPISIVRRETETGLGGWEPFEWFNCGSLAPRRFRQCLSMIFSGTPANMEQLNEIYTKTARAPLRPFDSRGSVGFKMRIVPPWDIPNLRADARLRKNGAIDLLCKAVRRATRRTFMKLIAEAFTEHDVVAFIMVRQDIFRWAISKYHGDGTGRPGHLQFRVASGDMSAVELPRLTFDRRRFGRIVDKCVDLHRTKRWWFESLTDAGVSVHPLRYEDFAQDRAQFFSLLLQHLAVSVPREVVVQRLAAATRLKRVHGDDISQYVENHEEITGLYGDRFIRW